MDIGKWYSYNGTPASSTSTHKAGIDVMVVSQNQINNTSLVRIRPWIMKLSGTGFWNYNSQTMTIKANNVSRTTKTQYDFREATTDDKEYLTSNYPFKRISGSGSLVSGAYVYDFTITHNDDGTKTIPIYALIPLSSSNGVNWTVDRDIELPTIPRANTLKCSYTTLEKPIKFSISKASSKFTSTINLSFYKENSVQLVGLGDIFTKTSSTSLTYTLTEEQLNEVLSYNKSKNIVVAFVSIITYNGSTQLGSNVYLFNIPLKQTNPIVSATYEDTNQTTIALTGNKSKIIKYVSQPKVTITATPQQQADIVSYSTIWGNSSSTTKETTFVNGIDSNILQVSAKDSRNWVGNISYDITENYIEYIKLGFEKFTLERPETTSNTINANVNGVWFNGNFGVSTNIVTLKFRYKERDGSYGNYRTISLTKNGNKFSFNGSIGSSYNYQKQYDFEFVLSDKVMSLITTFNVTSGESIIRVAETYVRILGDLKVRGNVTINDELVNKQVGDIVITSTNENPQDRLGGTWELIDKEFSLIDNLVSGFNPNTTNISSATPLTFSRSGHSISMRFGFVPKVNLTDSTVEIGNFDLQILGITQFFSDIRPVGWSDAGNGMIMFIITNEGNLTSVDVIPDSSIASGRTSYFSINVSFTKNYMLDEACDKFYWRKTA